MSRTQYKTSAIMIRSLDYGESDRIVTFFTEEFGKVKGIAKGAKRSRRRFVNALEPFSRSELLFSRRSSEGLALIEQCDVTDHFAGIRSELETTLAASYLVDLLDRFSVEGKRNPDLFRYATDFLREIDQGGISEPMIRIFEMRLLKFAGYEPRLDRCKICGRPLEEMGYAVFVPAEGWLRCRGECASRSPDKGSDGIAASIGTVMTLLAGMQLPVEKARRLVLTGRQAEEGRALLTGFIRHLLGSEPPSYRVLEEVKNRF
ncbi:MAG: DNA repair protein RecO [Syntrophales bacterium]|nr:DNA repair protein RecO [Syntrophales bacterium]HPL62573.1 DNA repair protein RecO [Syntrophales bacterium]